MKALKKLLVVVMVLSLLVHPAFVDVLLAIDYEGNDNPGSTIPASGDLYQKVQDAVVLPPQPPEPDPALEENQESQTQEAAPIIKIGKIRYVPLEGGYYDIVCDDGTAYDPINLPKEFQIEGLEISFEAKTHPYSASFHMGAPVVELTKVEAGKTIPGSTNLTPEEQAEAENWLKVKPVSVKVQPRPAFDHSSLDVYNYYDDKGNLIGSKTVSTTANVGESTIIWKDKNGTELGRIDILPSRFEVAPEQQPGMETIFGEKPANYTIRHDGVTGDTTYTYYDAQGNKIGQMTETYAQQSLEDFLNKGREITGQTFYDKTGKEIDLAAKIGSVDVDTAANVIKTLDRSTADSTLAALDKTNPNKANDIRIKCGMDPNMETMTPDAAADYLTKLNDPARAAALLAKLDPVKAADIIASSKMSEGDAARIFRKMDADKAAAILSARHPSEIDMGNGLIMTRAGEYGPVINAKKAAGILNQMSKTKAAAILGSDKMDKGVAGSILNNVATDDAVKILNRMSAGKAAEILSRIDLYGGLRGLWLGGGISKEKAAEILSSMSSRRAAAIIGSDKMNDRAAATLMGTLDVQTAVKILGKVSNDKAAAILSSLTYAIRKYLGDAITQATTADSRLWLPPGGITAEQAGNILAGLKAEKAAGILASDKMSVETAGVILTEAKKTNEQAVNDMLTKLDGTNKVKADQIREKIGAKPGTTLTAQEQANYGTIFGTTPVTSKTRPSDPNIVGAPVITDFFDKDGKLVGSMSQNPSTGHTIQGFLDKDGKTIDLADRLSKVDAQAAANVIKALDKETGVSILASDKMTVENAARILNKLSVSDKAMSDSLLTALGNTNKTKADAIRTQMNATAWIQNLGTLPADEAAAKIKAYVTNDATAKEIAAALAKLDPSVSARIIGSANISAETAGKVLAGMDATIAARILAYTPYSVGPGGAIVMPSSVPTDKAVAILNGMAANKAAAILGAFTTAPLDSYNIQSANKIINGLSADKAAELISKIPSSGTTAGTTIGLAVLARMSTDRQAEILASSKMDVKIAAGILGNANMAVDRAVAILNSSKMSVDAAAKILNEVTLDEPLWSLGPNGEVHPTRVYTLLTALDAVNKVKADQIREKMGSATTDITKMTADQAADYLTKLNDPAKAAIELAKLDANKAAAALNSTKMTSDMAAKILATMDPDKVAEILSASNDKTRGLIEGPNECSILAPAKAAEILTKMGNIKATAILGSLMMDSRIAGSILNNVAADSAVYILSAMSIAKAAEIFSALQLDGYAIQMGGISESKAKEILSKLAVSTAAAIIGSDKMRNDIAAVLMGALDVNTAVAILGKVSNDKVAAILSCLPAPAIKEMYATMHFRTPSISAEKAGNILAGLGADKAAAILASKNMSVDTAGKILTELNKTNAQAVTGILAKLDKVDKPKADLIRTKIAAINIGTMTPEAAAAYLSGLDPKAAAALLKTFIGSFYENAEAAAKIVAKMDAANAAKILAELNAFDAGVILGSDNIDVSTAMKIFSRMNTDKVVAILATCNTSVVILANVIYPNPPMGGAANSLTYKKAADILAAMINPLPGSAAALRGIMDKISADDAALIITQMDPERASVLLRQPEALPEGVMKQGGIGQLVKADKAAAILASKHMTVETASTILSKADANTQKVVLAQLDKTDKVKADQIRAQIAATDKSWLNNLGTLPPADAAAKITAYVKDAATAKEVADALNNLNPYRASQIIAQSNMTAQTAAQVFNQMTSQQVAGILTSYMGIRFLENSANLVNCPRPYGPVISDLKAAAILVAMDNNKAAQVLAALPAYTASNILFAQDANNPEPAVTNMKIIYLLRAMSADSAAAIISMYCDPRNGLQKIDLANGTSIKLNTAIPARVEQIFRKMVPSESAPIFASDNMSVKTAARIISEVKKGFPDKANLILNAIDAVNSEKATWIRTVINVLEGNYVPGPFIVKFKAGVSDKAIAETLNSVSGKVESVHNITNAGTFYLVSFPETISIVDALSLLQQTKLVQFAEPNFARVIGG